VPLNGHRDFCFAFMPLSSMRSLPYVETFGEMQFIGICHRVSSAEVPDIRFFVPIGIHRTRQSSRDV